MAAVVATLLTLVASPVGATVTCETAEIVWNHNENGGQSQSASITSGAQYFSGSTDLAFGPGLFENPDYAFTYILGGADEANFAAAKAANDYLQVSFTPSEDLELTEVGYGFWTNGPNDPEMPLGDFKIALEYATQPNFSDGAVLHQDIQVGAMQPGGYVTPTVPDLNVVLQGGTEYFFRFYLYDEQNSDPQNRVRFDDVFFPVNVVSTCETNLSTTPDPAVPGETVTISPAGKQCSERWALMTANNWGSLEITWPDGTATTVDPLSDPVVVTVPAAMEPGTATITVISEDGVPIDVCSGEFAVASDATVPVVDPTVGLGLIGLSGAAFAVWTTPRRRRARSALST